MAHESRPTTDQEHGETPGSIMVMDPREVPEEWVNNSFHHVESGGGLPEEREIVNSSEFSEEEKRRLLKEFHADRVNRENMARQTSEPLAPQDVEGQRAMPEV